MPKCGFIGGFRLFATGSDRTPRCYWRENRNANLWEAKSHMFKIFKIVKLFKFRILKTPPLNLEVLGKSLVLINTNRSATHMPFYQANQATKYRIGNEVALCCYNQQNLPRVDRIWIRSFSLVVNASKRDGNAESPKNTIGFLKRPVPHAQ